MSIPSDRIVADIEKAGYKFVTRRQHGGEWHGPCPRCGGHDRCCFWPHHESGKARWWCRHCHQGDDVLAWAVAMWGWQFRRAAAYYELAVDVLQPRREAAPPPRPVPAVSAPPPPFAWQTRAQALIAYGETQRRDPRFNQFLAARGLPQADVDRAVHHLRIGYNPDVLFDQGALWGDGEGPKRRVVIPQGILIPNFGHNDAVWGIRVRRVPQGAYPKYHAVAGSTPALFNARFDGCPEAVVLCESELDALVVNHATQGRCQGVSTGSTTWCRNAFWVGKLLALHAPLINGFDADEAGREATFWWASAVPGFPSSHPFPAGCKDINDILMLHGAAAVRRWLDDAPRLQRA